MKKSIIITIAGIVFATLFYTQSFGINALFYSIFLGVALVLSGSKIRFTNTTLFSCIGMLASAAAISLHGSTLSIVTYFISTFLFIGYVASFQSSIYVSWLNGVYNAVFGVFHSFLFQLEEPKKAPTKKSIPIGQILKGIAIPLVLVIIFTTLYRTSNPIFNEWLIAIDLSFIDVLWVFTAILGAFIMLNMYQPRPLEDVTEKDKNYPNELFPRALNTKQLKSVYSESQIGFISILSLNLLLVIVLISEVIFLTNLTDLKASILSDAVHQGVYASIISIVLAICVIAFIFRGDVNFLKNIEKLRVLTFVWIALNLLLVGSICIKNYLYIHDHGLTHKRIGVMVYLLLTIIGLFTTYLKVSNRLNFVYLLRRNIAIGYACIAIYSVINWSAIITNHNLQANKIDQPYLESLLPQNALILKEYDLYEEYKRQDKIHEYYLEKYNESLFINRNWQEFNWIAYKLKQNEDGISK
jgi:hypothetical protein